MNEESRQKIEAIIRNGYDFRFGDYISRGFQLLQKNLGGFIAFTLIFFALVVVIQFIPLIGPLATNIFLTPALMAGAYLVAYKLDREEPAEFGDFFKGFDYIGQLALASLVSFLIIIASLIPFVLVTWNSGLVEWYMDALRNPMEVQGSMPPLPPAWSLLLLAPAVYLGVSYVFAPLFVVFYKFDFWTSLEFSRKLITKKWVPFFAFYLVASIIGMAGIILFCIGVLATFPAFICMIYAAFEDLTQLNREPDGDNIEKHLIT